MMDCIQGMKEYPDKYFDLAVVDPPYGIGIAKWDIKPNDEYWDELFRVSKIKLCGVQITFICHIQRLGYAGIKRQDFKEEH